MERSVIREHPIQGKAVPNYAYAPSGLHFFPHTQPHHEALADLDRIAVGGADARLVVDAGCDEGGAALCERSIEQLVEIFLIACPGALAQSGRARECHIV